MALPKTKKGREKMRGVLRKESPEAYKIMYGKGSPYRAEIRERKSTARQEALKKHMK